MGEESEKLARSLNNGIDGLVGCITWCIVGFIILLAIGFAAQLTGDLLTWLS